MLTNTPLRYPGGKTVITPFFEKYIHANNMNDVTYVEPYAGGAGAALQLLFRNSVSNIIINDASVPVYSFWNSLVNYSDDFLALFDETPVTLQEWNNQKQIFKYHNTQFSVELGFATFFLNRCNRSGILNAGPIGGNSEEKQILAVSKIDARYKKEKLRKKIEKIIEKKEQIRIFNLDALEFLTFINEQNELIDNIFVYLDPPYYDKGSKLYLNFYEHQDHCILANYLINTFAPRWILSYDNVQAIRDLYQDFSLYSFELPYSAQDRKKGSELILHSHNSVFPEVLQINRGGDNIIIKPL